MIVSRNSYDADLLAALKNKINAIEKMRNCIAHHRRPSSRTEEGYQNAQPLISKLLDDYLELWSWNEAANGLSDEESNP